MCGGRVGIFFVVFGACIVMCRFWGMLLLFNGLVDKGDIFSDMYYFYWR